MSGLPFKPDYPGFKPAAILLPLAKIELAKHRLVYALLRWNLPLLSKLESPERGLVFDFKANPNDDRAPKVMTGHASGVITLNIAEADDVERMMAKQNMAEVYRTLLGHFRHEIGHYYWDVLVANSDYLARWQLFGMSAPVISRR